MQAGRLRRRALVLAPSLTLACCLACRPVDSPPSSQPAVSNRPLQELSEVQIDRVVRELHTREPDLARRAIAIARRFVGQPYKLGVLGEGGREPYDRDPLYCLDASDCVTFVEQVYALALASSWSEFLPALNRIRYRDGEIGFVTRNHFTEADWNINNAWLFDDVTAKLAGGRAAVALRQRVARRAFFRRAGVDRSPPDEDFVGSYIPRDRLSRVDDELRDGDVIEFVRGTPAAPYVGHMGLIFRDPAGQVLLLHSGRPAVRILPLAEYLAGHTKIIGAKFLRPRPLPVRTAIGSPDLADGNHADN